MSYSPDVTEQIEDEKVAAKLQQDRIPAENFYAPEWHQP